MYPIFCPSIVETIDNIKTNSFSSSDNIYISGRIDGGYYIAKLNDNFTDNIPTGTEWEYRVSINNDAYEQLWDVGRDEKIVFVAQDMPSSNLPQQENILEVFRLNSDGLLDIVPNWRYHYGIENNSGRIIEGAWTPYTSNKEVSVYASSIRLAADLSGSLRSWTQMEYNSSIDDENGNFNSKKPWPMDLFFQSEFNVNDKPASMAQSANLKIAPDMRFDIGGISIDKRSNHIYIGGNVNTYDMSSNRGEIPFIIAYDENGNKKWWDRLYQENTTNHNLTQTIIDLNIDYSSNSLLVLATQRGSGANNLWEGNSVSTNSLNSGSSIHNSPTGGSIATLGWIGKLSLPDGKLLYSTFFGGYTDGLTITSPYSDPSLDGWQNHNIDNPELSNISQDSKISSAPSGNIAILTNGYRFITTSNAYQKQLKPSEGTSSRGVHVRVYNPDLTNIIYSSLLTGEWNTATGNGGDNTSIDDLEFFNGGVILVGYQQGLDGINIGNSIPTSSIPSWGDGTNEGQEAILAKLTFQQLHPEFSISPIGNNCENTNSTIINLSSSNATSFVWNFGNGASISTSNSEGPHQVMWSSIGVKTIQIAISDGNGNTSTLSKNYTISSQPNSDITVTFNGTVISLGQSISFDPNNPSLLVNFKSSIPFDASYQYIWEIEDHNQIHHYYGYSVEHHYLVDGNYTAKLTILNGNCSQTIERIVDFSSPIRDINAEFEANITSQCEDYVVKFTQETENNNISWCWNFGENASPQYSYTRGPHNVHYNNAGSKLVSLTVSNGFIEKSHSITINIANDIEDFSIQESIVASSSNGVLYSFAPLFSGSTPTGVNYEWNTGNLFDITNSIFRTMNSNYLYTIPGEYIVSLSISNDNCKNTVYKKVIVDIPLSTTDQTPNKACFTISPSQRACVNDVIYLTDMSTGYSYEEDNTRELMFLPDPIIDIDNLPKMMSFHWADPGQKLIVLKTGGQSEGQSIYSRLYTINDYPNADFQITGNTCASSTSTFNLSANSTTEEGNFYAWEIDGIADMRITPSITIDILPSMPSRTAQLEVTNSNGCKSIIKKNINQCPTNDVSAGIIVTPSTTGCNTNKIILRSASTGNITAYTWIIQDSNGLPISGIVSPLIGAGPHEIPLSQDIQVELTITYINIQLGTGITETISMNIDGDLN